MLLHQFVNNLSYYFLLSRLIASLHNAEGNMIDTDTKCVFAPGNAQVLDSRMTTAEGRSTTLWQKLNSGIGIAVSIPVPAVQCN